MASDKSDGEKPSPDATVDILLSELEDATDSSEFVGRNSLTGTIPPPSRLTPPQQAKASPPQTSTLIGTPTPATTPANLRSPLRPSQPNLRADRPSLELAGETDPHAHNALVIARACEAELLQSPEPMRAARLHFEAARLYESPVGDLRRAAAHYQEALALAPDHLPALRGARRVLIARKNYQAALTLFDAEARLTREQAHKASILHAKARLLDDVMGQKTEARDAYVAALELDRSDASLLKSVEQVEQASEQWDALSRTLETEANAVASDAHHRAALIVQRAQILEHRRKDPEGAIELYETALAVDPQVKGALSALKRLHHAQRRWRDLIGVLLREAEQTTDAAVRAMAYYRMGRLQMERLGNRDEALVALQRAAHEAPDDPLILQELARLYEQGEKWEPLVRVLEKLANDAQGEGDKLARLHRLGQLSEDRLNNETAAMGFHEAALQLSPSYVPSLQALGKIYTRGERWSQLIAINLAEAGASDDARRRAAAHARVADIFENQLKQIEDAAEHHSRALALVPGYATSFKALSRIYGELGKHRELIELYERALDGPSDNDRSITYLFKIGSVYEDSLQEPIQAAQI
ncbi:MAG: tetratricopeptide repeat protein [Sandaracinaceae bacterium]|nr:tetratricopeptide repeat protein [Sandaracinaceae bacterium]